jgi:hypothetical protein
VLFIAWTTEALVLHLIARRLCDRPVTLSAHALSALAALVLVDRILSATAPEHALFNARALADLWAVAVSLALAFALGRSHAPRVYLLVGQFALAALLVREFDGFTLLAILSLQALFVHFLARTTADRAVRIAAHLLYLGVAAWLADRLYLTNLSALLTAGGGIAVSADALANLLTIACGLSISALLTDADERGIYRVAVHVAFLMWLWKLFAGAPSGQALATIAWGVYAAFLLIYGLRRGVHFLRLAGLGTLLAVVGKLFLVDLANLAAIWRVLLFLGFGGLFLLLSYYFRALWKIDRDEPKAEGRPPA